jgi:hypothetical protein
MLEIHLVYDDEPTYGFTHRRSVRQAETHLPTLREHARQLAANNGLKVADAGFEIHLVRHAESCTGNCPDELGLQPGCNIVQSYPVTED